MKSKLINKLTTKNYFYSYFIKIFVFTFLNLLLYIIKPKPLDMNIIFIEFKALVEKYKYLIKIEENISEDSPIWVMWYQGFEKAPPLIKACIHSIFENKANHPVHLLDQYNLKRYIKLPKYILTKFKKNKFTITHFSDIVRTALLSTYGGYWIDATYFITSPINYTSSSLFTLKLAHCYSKKIISKCIWAGNFLAMPKNSFLSTYSYQAFLLYWKYYDSLIDYFLLDYVIYIAYKNVKELRDLIEKIPYIECNIFVLFKSLNETYKKSFVSCPFNKLKRREQKYIKYNDKGITNYGYIINKYN